MNEKKRRVIDLDIKRLPSDARERKEKLADVFGQYLVWARDGALSHVRKLIEDEDARSGMGRVFREPYELAANLSVAERHAAYGVVDEALAAFASQVLVLLSQDGADLRVGDMKCAVRFRLAVEIFEADTDERATLFDDVISDANHFGNLARWRRLYGESSLNERRAPPSSPRSDAHTRE